MSLFSNIQFYFRKATYLDKLLYVLIAGFIFSVLFPHWARQNLALSSYGMIFYHKPWTLLTYAWVHVRLFHVLSNLIVLFYIGNIFLDFFSEKKLLLYFFSGVLVGGILFLQYPYFATRSVNSTLIGASAGVMAILVGIATKIPHYAIKIRFIGSVELWVLSVFFVGLSVLGIMGINIGGALAHLGGALTGFLLTQSEGMLKKRRQKNDFQKVYTNLKRSSSKKKADSSSKKQRKIDAILDKISKSGYDSLTQKEKEFLFNQKE